jgi:hypothetical protein
VVGDWRGPAPHATPALLVEWAVACNNRSLRRNPAGPPAFQPGGRERLLDLAVEFARRFEGHGAVFPDGFLDVLGELAVALKDGVFTESGAETARTFVLCLVTAARLRARPESELRGLLDRIEDGVAAEVAAMLRESYEVSK